MLHWTQRVNKSKQSSDESLNLSYFFFCSGSSKVDSKVGNNQKFGIFWCTFSHLETNQVLNRNSKPKKKVRYIYLSNSINKQV